MKICPECNKEVPEHANKCKYCDYRFGTAETGIPVTTPEESSSSSITDKKAKTKKCAHCAMEIPAEASICPYCRKSTSRLVTTGEDMMKTGKQIMTLVFSFIMLAVIVFCAVSLLSN